MKRILTGIVLGAASIAAMAFANSSTKVSPQSLKTGQRIFAQSCASCHAIHGSSTSTAPGLKGYYTTHTPGHTDTEVRTIIRNGKGKMPGFSNLGESQVDSLIAYLKTL